MVRTYLSPARSVVVVFVALLGASLVPSSRQASPGKLRYAFRQDQTVGYRIEITADCDDATETLSGIVTYKCKLAEGDTLQLTYSGGLVKSSKAKPSQGFSRIGPPRIGPPMFGRSRAFGPFFDSPFRGLVTTTNQLTVTSLGEVRSMEGDSQLPYLLGDASLLIFEHLSDEDKESWSVTEGVLITEEGGRRWPPHPLPFEPEDPKRRTAGSEKNTYRVRNVDGPKVVVDKTYHLDSPAPTKEAPGFQIEGTGTWTFNRELGLPESLDVSQKLTYRKGNTTTAVPMTVKYTRLSDAELQAHQQDRQQKQEAARKQLAELQEKQANTPLTEEQIVKICENLGSDRISAVLMALQTLQKKNPQNSDPRIATAVDALRQHKNDHVRRTAEKTAEKWPLPEGVLSVAVRKRTWTDNSGTFTIEAEFLGLAGQTVRLRRSDGKELELPLARLSQADQAAARELAKGRKSAVDNPFD